MTHKLDRRSFLTCVASAVAARLVSADVRELPPLLDHFILGCNDLDAGVRFVEQHTGIRAAFGGVHPGRGTRNALLSLGTRRYLEIMAPDPAQPNVAPQIQRLPDLKEPRIVGWAAHVDDIEKLAANLREHSVEFDGPRAGSRQRPDGRTLQWKSLSLKDDFRGLLPFFIEWAAGSIHPSTDSPQGCDLSYFGAVSDFDQFKNVLNRLNLQMPAAHGDKSLLRATIRHASQTMSVTS